MAQADIAAAQVLLASVVVEAPVEGELSQVDLVQQRLDLVTTALPDDPVTAAADLELAWEQLDSLMAALLLPAEPGVETEP